MVPTIRIQRPSRRMVTAPSSVRGSFAPDVPPESSNSLMAGRIHARAIDSLVPLRGGLVVVVVRTRELGIDGLAHGTKQQIHHRRVRGPVARRLMAGREMQ